tara:strand:+ start:1842 stop:2012 length:171 start_codon:yes stop_codon:yes gene_type:complete
VQIETKGGIRMSNEKEIVQILKLFHVLNKEDQEYIAGLLPVILKEKEKDEKERERE